MDPDLLAVDFIILDEVHERGLESDFALALLMSTLNRRSTLKVILMSATISTDKFAHYLGGAIAGNNGVQGSGGQSTANATRKGASGSGQATVVPNSSLGLTSNSIPIPAPAPVLSIPGYTYPVTEYYKGDYEGLLREEDGEGSGYFTSQDPVIVAATGGEVQFSN
jgi:HrpA-like RNA helicase